MQMPSSFGFVARSAPNDACEQELCTLTTYWLTYDSSNVTENQKVAIYVIVT